MAQLSLLDKVIKEADLAVRTIFPPAKRVAQRLSPAENLPEKRMSMQERKHTAGLMRVNHTGEVCAQALYQGQGLTAQLQHVKQQMQEAADEEVDHLAWCEKRLEELGASPSVLNAFWYSGSFLMGALAGLAGDKISLGFVAETEKQVSAHLQKHIHNINPQDEKTKAILEQMQRDEAQHAEAAKRAGALDFPAPVRFAMRILASLMTKTSYYI